MPRFYFDIELGNDDRLSDEEGSIFSDAELARAYAEGMASTYKGREPTDPRHVIVRDEKGRTIADVSPGAAE